MLKKQKSERLIWLDITITLLALELMAYFYYGIRIVVTGAICVCAALIVEFVSVRLMGRKFTADDLSCTSDALILTLMLPATIDLKLPVIACVIAFAAGKNIFGGRANMIFSPAAVAYLIMLTSWRSDLLSYPEPHTKAGIFEKAGDLVNSASYTYNHTGSFKATDFEMLLGNFSGPIGAVSILLLLVSALILIFRRDISLGAFVGTIFGTAFFAYFCPISGTGLDSVKYILATNMTLFAAIYIVSDKRIAPRMNYYAFFYGMFIAIASYIVILTTGKENVIVIMSVLFTPFALGFKNLEKYIGNLHIKEQIEKNSDNARTAEEISNEIRAENASAMEELFGEEVTDEDK